MGASDEREQTAIRPTVFQASLGTYTVVHRAPYLTMLNMDLIFRRKYQNKEFGTDNCGKRAERNHRFLEIASSLVLDPRSYHGFPFIFLVLPFEDDGIIVADLDEDLLRGHVIEYLPQIFDRKMDLLLHVVAVIGYLHIALRIAAEMGIDPVALALFHRYGELQDAHMGRIDIDRALGSTDRIALLLRDSET